MHSLRNLFTGLLFMSSLACFCQNPTQVENLKAKLKASPSLEREVEVLKILTLVENPPDSVIKYSTLLVEKAGKASEPNGVQQGYHLRGVSWRRLSEFEKALEDLFKAVQIAEDMEQLEETGKIYVEIGNIYSESGNYELADLYYDRGIGDIRKSGNKLLLGKSLYNEGDDLYEREQIDSALVSIKEALRIFKTFDKPQFEGYALGNIGRIYLKKGELEPAEKNLTEAISILEEIKDYNGLCDYYLAMAEYSQIKEDYPTAFAYAEKSLDAARNYNMKSEEAKAHLFLSNLYETTGDVGASYTNYKTYVALKDSVRNVETVQEMANLRSSFEIGEKQKEVDLLNEQKKNQKTIVIATIVALVLILLLAFGLYRRNKYIGRTKKIIEKEKYRSELLLLNILPQETASELKEKGKVEAKRFEAVSILFTDFKNFTHYAENLSPEELVRSVDFYFTGFDKIIEKYGLEKIKTVGDSYMCAAGVPFPAKDHAVKIVLAACEMMDFVEQARKVESQQETRFEARIGINSGPVIAGVVGSKKFAYDIWGDAVNIASRMESTGETGQINISEFTYELVKKHFECTFRGEVLVKNKGMMKMYYVDCPKPSASFVNNAG